MKLDQDNGKPIYQQIIDYYKMAVLSGRYRDGDRIPPVRELAIQLRINPNTVAKAYKMMQEEGLLASRPGGGNFIVVPEKADFQREREESIREDIVKLLDKSSSLGILPSRLQELINSELKERNQ